MSRLGLPGADDPAYQHELEELDKVCASFRAEFEQGDFDGSMLMAGAILAQVAAVYKLAPPAGFMDPAELFRRDEHA